MRTHPSSRLHNLLQIHWRPCLVLCFGAAVAWFGAPSTEAQSIPLELRARLNLVSLPLSPLSTDDLTSRDLAVETGADFVARLEPGGRWQADLPALGTPSFRLEAGRGYLVSVPTARRVVVGLFPDADGDGLPDWWERRFFMGDADPKADPDGDGLDNHRELLQGTDPTSSDTDGDGWSDLAEVLAGTDSGRMSSSLRSVSIAGLRGIPATTAPAAVFTAWLDILNPNPRDVTVTSAALIASTSRVTAITSTSLPATVAAARTLTVSFVVRVPPDLGVQTVTFGAVANAREDRLGLSLSSVPSTGLKTMGIRPDGQALFELISRTDPYSEWAQFTERQGVFSSSAPHGPKARVWINGAAAASLDGAGMSNGSVIVKENLEDGGSGLNLKATTVMYKVQGFNSSGGDWFWAQFGPGGSVMAEGAVGMCVSCHSAAASNDYIFLHQFR